MPKTPATTIHAIIVCVFLAAAAARTEGPDVNGFRLEQFEQLKEQISRRGLAKRAARQKVLAEQCADRHALIWESDETPADVVIRRTRALLDDLKGSIPDTKWQSFHDRLGRCSQTTRGLAKRSASQRSAAAQEAFMQAAAVRREIAFANPLLNFDRILCFPYTGYGKYHMAWIHTSLGKQPFILEDPFGSPRANYFMESSIAENGPNGGSTLNPSGYNSIDLSVDAKTVFFAYADSACGHKGKFYYPINSEDLANGYGQGDEGCQNHLFSVGIDGSNLRQLTFGEWSHQHPCALPNGRVVFVSFESGGNDRCVAEPSHALWSMKADGSDIIQLSFHETAEWFPRLDNNGMLMYTRWDYVDRSADCAQHLWTCYPDGRDPRAPHGNYSHPWVGKRLVDKYPEVLDVTGYSIPEGIPWDGLSGAKFRPYAEYSFRPIPNSEKIIGVAGGHHGSENGSIIIIDPTVVDDGLMSQVTRVTPNIPFPESEGECTGSQLYGYPWALSEDYYLVHGNNQLMLLDKFGNEEIIFDNANCPIPLRPRQIPALATKTFDSEDADPNHPKAAISVQDVYNSYPYPLPDDVVEQRKIKWIRVIQIIPKNLRWDRNKPPMAYESMSPGRIPLGVAKVEEDGSAYFEAPVGREIYFQILDENHMAVQTMRSGTYVHKGEHLSCVGCHESKWESPPAMNTTPLALQRGPSPLVQEVEGGPWPVAFESYVNQPVFQKTCIPCHEKEGKNTGMFEYDAHNMWVSKMIFSWPGGIGNTQGYAGSRSIPGFFGARVAGFGKGARDMYEAGRITEEEFRRVVVWLDCNSMRYGDFRNTEKQDAGEIVWPSHYWDPDNPTGVESGQPDPDPTTVLNNLREKGYLADDASLPSRRGAIAVAVRGSRVVIENPSGRRVHWTLHDLKGSTVLDRHIPGDTRTVHADISHLPPGMYCVRLRSGRMSTATTFLRAR